MQNLLSKMLRIEKVSCPAAQTHDSLLGTSSQTLTRCNCKTKKPEHIIERSIIG